MASSNKKSLVNLMMELTDGEHYLKALEVCNQLILEYEMSELYFQRAYLFGAMADYEKAISDYTRAIQLAKEDPDGYVNRGNCYLKTEQYQAALRDYSKAIELSPDMLMAFNNRGWAYFKLELFQEAQIDLMHVIEADDKYLSAYHNLGIVYCELGRFQSGLTCLKKADRLRPNDLEILRSIGLAYEGLDDPENAKKYLQSAIEIDPENIKAQQSLAWLLSTNKNETARDGERALSHAIWCCEKTYWRNVDSLQTLAASYAECGLFEKAIKWQQEVLKLSTPEKDQYIKESLVNFEKGLPIRD